MTLDGKKRGLQQNVNFKDVELKQVIMEKESRKPMTLHEFIDLTNVVIEKHSYTKGRKIKYITPNVDTRTGDIFSVQFRGYLYPEKIFSLVNENSNRDLKKWIYSWLDGDID